ncbi:MORN repeat protein [Leptospira ryugenii]|uniref:MORN repeat protein n=1 Tax=Leptospira ryugenii TaxID=1917863 RepID=A0A2P2DWW0_9LEPT|nr:hypothetical protein [Leptospira ryugenii]GBF49125.1 MORN repeat protein [Leptospira ryugenii]
MSILVRRELLFISILAFVLSFNNCSSSEEKTNSNEPSQDTKTESAKERKVEIVEGADPSKTNAKKGCVEGDCVNGLGKYIYDNGDIYTGSFKNDLREGKGQFEYVDGEKFVGNYLADQKDGAGEYFFKNGDKYVGEFKSGQINGKGIYTFQDGKSLNGEFKNDGMEGKGTLIESGSPKECQVSQRKLLCD